MPIEIPGAAEGLPPRRWAQVLAIEALTRRVRRVRLGGDDLEGFAIPAPGAHVKLILPPPGSVRPALPVRYEGRRAVFAEGDAPPHLRTYTPLHFDAERLELEVDMLVHGTGVASDWVQRAQVGDEIIVAGPRGGWEVPGDGAWYLVVADETALPAAEQVLGAVPEGAQLTAYLEVADAAEVRALPGVESSAIRWLTRDDGMTPGACLEAALNGHVFPAGEGYAWVACEAGAMRRVRRHLLEECGIPADRMVTRGYWKVGAADHPDGDYGQDEIGHR